MKKLSSLLWLLVVALSACSPRLYQPEQSVDYFKYDVKTSQANNQLQQLLAPYSATINKTMNEEIGELSVPLVKKMPESSLGFWMTDAYLAEAEKIFGTRVDIALMNTGGIRVNAWEPGKITLGSIYELMPFDNLLVLVNLNGQQLEELLNHIASRGGWPISGATYKIEKRKATNILIAKEPLNLNKHYTIALSDYIANGGDDCTMLTRIPQQNKGYLQRDALVHFVRNHTAEGRKIGIPSMGRVQMAD